MEESDVTFDPRVRTMSFVSAAPAWGLSVEAFI